MINSIFPLMFAVITALGFIAFFNFPIRVGYGPVAAWIFRILIFVTLSLSGFKFFLDMDKLDQLREYLED